MTSVFEVVNKKMVKELGGKDLIPVKCLLDATKFRHFFILQNKSQSWFWGQSDDVPVGYTLMDILEPSSSFPETEMSRPILISDTVGQKWKGVAGVNAGAEGSVSGDFTQSHVSTLEIQAISIPAPKLECLQNRKLVYPEPSFFNDCRLRGDNLYVVTEAIELTKDTVLKADSSIDFSGKLSLPWNAFVKGQVHGQSLNKREKTQTIPQGSVLAYRKKKLLINEQAGGKEAAIRLISTDVKQKTFQNMKFQASARSGSPRAQCFCPENVGIKLAESSENPSDEFLRSVEIEWEINSISPVGRIEEPYHLDFKCLQEEVSQKTKCLSRFPKEVQDVVFRSILALLGDRESLRKLMDKLELDRVEHMDGPGGKILDELRQNSIPSWLNPRDLMLYLLQALMVLSDKQLDLLAQSMEKRILLQQRELVRSILQPNFKYPWSIPFTLQPQLLAPLQGEGLAITYGLLSECGLKMELNNPKSTWDLEAKTPLSALYGTLSLLQQLAEPSGLC